VGLSDVEALVADGFIDAWVDQSWAGAWEDVPTRASKTTGWTYHLAYILIHRAQIEGGNRRRAARAAGLDRCRHYVLHGMFDAYEGFDTIHKVPGKLKWGVYAYAMAALVRRGGELVFSDGHYISWANSYSYVTGSVTIFYSYCTHHTVLTIHHTPYAIHHTLITQVTNPLDDDSYLDRPTGLLTCTDVAWLAGVLDGADASVASVRNIAGPTMAYDRGSLVDLMRYRPDDNANEWVDEQVGLVLKYGMPLLKVMRLEDGIEPLEHPDGVFLSVPTTVSAVLVANLSALAKSGAPVVLLGRCDQIATALLAMAGVECQGDTILPAHYGGASIPGITGSINVSLGRRANVRVLEGTKALATLDNGDVFMTKSVGGVVYAQLNDYTHPVTSNLAVTNYGHGTPHFVLAANAKCRSLQVVGGMDQTQPVTLHMWSQQDGTLVILAGNLEGNFCGGIACSVPTALTSRSVTVAVDTGAVARSWVFYSQDPAVLPQLKPLAIGPVEVQIDLPFASSRIYFLKPVPNSTGLLFRRIRLKLFGN
jgi:hypothetical protein